MNPLHIPVLQEEILEMLQESSLRICCDATLGFGGHAKSLLNAHPEIETYLAFDQDAEAIQLASKELSSFSQVDYIHKNFQDISQVFREKNLFAADFFLFDLGVSSMQLDQKEKGFSFMKDGPLDMRMDSTNTLKAETVVNEYSEKELGEIFREFGEEPMWKAISKAIHQSRKKKRITTTLELSEVIQSVKKRRGRLHPATLAFQALRIFVNGELDALKKGIQSAAHLLAKSGSIFVICFHSLEDRIVKWAFRELAGKDSPYEIVTKKPITATRQEIKKNPRARSAKLRALKRRG